MLGGVGKSVQVIAGRFVRGRGVRVVQVGGSSSLRVEEVVLEEDQCAFRVVESPPLLDLARAYPQPPARGKGVTGEVDGVPQRAAADGEQVMESRPLRRAERTVADAGE